MADKTQKQSNITIELHSVNYDKSGTITVVFNKLVNILFATKYIASAYSAVTKLPINAKTQADLTQGKLYHDLQDLDKNPLLTFGIGSGSRIENDRYDYFLMNGKIDNDDKKRYQIVKDKATDRQTIALYSHLENICKK